jgi:hypothetical protein
LLLCTTLPELRQEFWDKTLSSQSAHQISRQATG